MRLPITYASRIAEICAAGSDTQGPVPNIGDAIADQLQEWPVALKRTKHR